VQNGQATAGNMTHDNARDFKAFFCDATGLQQPYDRQIRVAVDGLPELLPIPTGLGKTEGAVLAWAWRKLVAEFDEPLHLVYCLPMRTLVRQTVHRLNRYFEAAAAKHGIPRVPVYRLMSGAIDEKWATTPDGPWVLVGTQDQLLSRALNRGYAMSRFEWPVHFGLLNQDCHWIVDEVQLMGPGLWTTSQLDWMRRKRFPALKPCRTTWMSATVGEGFLATTDRKNDGLDKADAFDPRLDHDKSIELRRRLSARRPVEWFKPSTKKRAQGFHEQIASRADAEHHSGTLSLVICNTVKEAQEVFNALPDRVPKILLTSRFRREDRRRYEQQLIDFEARRKGSGSWQVGDDPGLVCVSTQVVEAGLDISAHRLWSQLAPWPSAVQRLGRLNRDGRDASAGARFWEAPKGKEPKRDGEVWVGPYPKRNLDAAKTLIDALGPLSLEMPFTKAIAGIEQTHRQLLECALRPEPAPLPRALDVHGLFSTERDLHGGFTDVSAFVRGLDPDADVTVFWRHWPGTRPPSGEALDGPAVDPDAEGCAVAVYRLSESLKGPPC
jgi:CRISPR-associated endonuclease/helicase Cas3